MILLLDSSTSLCELTLVDGDVTFTGHWQADRQLAKGLLGWLQQVLKEHNKTWSDVTGIAAYRGPGSFTGLRIGLTVLNTLADSLSIPIVGERSEQWQHDALLRLSTGQNDQVVLPYYDRDANITTQRK